MSETAAKTDVPSVLPAASSDLVETRSNSKLSNQNFLSEHQLKVVRHRLEEAIVSNDKEYEKEIIPWDKELEPIFREIDLYFENYFSQLGISLPNKTPKVALLKFTPGLSEGGFSISRVGFIGIYDYELFHNDPSNRYHDFEKQIRLYNLARKYAHERYHSYIKELNYYDGFLLYRQRQGLAGTINYNSNKQRGFQEGYALEEGLTKQLEWEVVTTLLSKQFPLVYENFELLLLQPYRDKTLNSNLMDKPMKSLYFDVASLNKLNIGTSYPNSIVLVEYLELTVPNFRFLAENMRLNGDMIPLIRAMYARFDLPSPSEVGSGENLTQKVFGSTEATAVEALQWLQKQVKPFTRTDTLDRSSA